MAVVVRECRGGRDDRLLKTSVNIFRVTFECCDTELLG